MTLTFVVGPFVVAQAAFNGYLQAFLYIVLHAFCGFSPCHEPEPLSVVHPFTVGVHAAFVDGKAETCDFVVVAKVLHFRFCTRRPISMTEFLIVLIMCVCLVINE